MVRIYLDLETYRPKKEGAFTDERIIAVGLLRDETPYAEGSYSSHVEPTFFTEWPKGSEKQVLVASLEFLEQMLREHRFTVVAGFNILRYDIPLIIAKGATHKIREIDVHSKLWYDTYTIDYFQELLPANQNLFKGLRLDRIVEKAKEVGLKPPDVYGTGADVKKWYEDKMYDEVLKHLAQDLQIVRWLDLVGVKRLLAESVRVGSPLFRE
jgi:hypothetical protein